MSRTRVLDALTRQGKLKKTFAIEPAIESSDLTAIVLTLYSYRIFGIVSHILHKYSRVAVSRAAGWLHTPVKLLRVFVVGVSVSVGFIGLVKNKNNNRRAKTPPATTLLHVVVPKKEERPI